MDTLLIIAAGITTYSFILIVAHYLRKDNDILKDDDDFIKFL